MDATTKKTSHTLNEIQCENIWNVFLPRHLFSEHSKFLCGDIIYTKRMICIYGMLDTEPNTLPPNVVGMWRKSDKYAKHSQNLKDSFIQPSQNIWVNIFERSPANEIHCHIKIKNNSNMIIEPPVVCVLFEPQDLVSSFVLMKFHDIDNNRSTNYISKVNQKRCEGNKLIEDSVLLVAKSLYTCSNIKLENEVKIFHKLPKPNRFAMFVNIVPWLIISIVIAVGNSLKKG